MEASPIHPAAAGHEITAPSEDLTLIRMTPDYLRSIIGWARPEIVFRGGNPGVGSRTLADAVENGWPLR